MISNVVPDCMRYAQDKLYGWEQSLVGPVQGSNLHPVLSRLAALPIVISDLTLEILGQTFSTVEYTAFTAFSLLSSLFYLVKLDGGSAVTAFRYTLFNAFYGIHSAASAILKTITSPLFLIAQLSLTLTDPQNAKSIDANFCKVPVITDDYSEEVEDIDPAASRNFTRVQMNWYAAINRIGSLKGMPRFIVYPMSIVFANMDILFQILKKVSMTVECVIRVVFGLFKLPVWYALGKTNNVSGEIKRIFSLLHQAGDSIARCVASIVLQDVSWACQTIAICLNPRKVKQCENTLYGPHSGDSRYRLNGFGEPKNWMKDQPRIVKEGYKFGQWDLIAQKFDSNFSSIAV